MGEEGNMKRFLPMLCLFWFAFSCIPIPSLANAADSAVSVGPLSLSEAIRTAAEKNPKIHASYSQVEAAQSRITQARSGLLPQIYVSEAFNRTNNPMFAFGARLNQGRITQEDFDPARLNDPDSINNFNTAFALDWSLFEGGKTWIGWQQARQSHEAETLMSERTKQAVIAETVAAYMALLLARENLSVLDQALETARAHLKMVRARFESGLVVKSDLLRAQVHIAELEQQRLHADSQIKVAAAVLNAAMGVAVGSDVSLTGRLEISSEIQGSLEDWINTALNHRPDQKQMKILEEIAQKEISRSRGGHLPNLNLVGTYEINSEDFSDSADSYAIGAVVRLNLYSGLRISSKIKEAHAELRRTQAMQKELDLGIRVQTRQAFFQAQSAWGRIQVARAAVAQAEETLRIVRNRYQNGLLAIVSLLDAEVALRQSRMNHFRSLHDYKVAHALLEFAAGTINISFQ